MYVLGVRVQGMTLKRYTSKALVGKSSSKLGQEEIQCFTDKA